MWVAHAISRRSVKTIPGPRFLWRELAAQWGLAPGPAPSVWRFIWLDARRIRRRYRNGVALLSRYMAMKSRRYDGARAAAGDMAFQMQLPSGAMERIADAETQAIAEALLRSTAVINAVNFRDRVASGGALNAFSSSVR